MTLEAKSEALPTGLVSMENVRQTNTHLRSLATDRHGAIPDGSVSVIVTPKELVDPDAVAIADDHLHLCAPPTIRNIAQDTVEACASWATLIEAYSLPWPGDVGGRRSQMVTESARTDIPMRSSFCASGGIRSRQKRFILATESSGGAIASATA